MATSAETKHLIPLKHEEKIQIDSFPKKTYKWPMVHEKTLNIINQRNANQNHIMRYHLTPVRMAVIQKEKKGISKCWREIGENDTLVHCW